MFVVAIIPGPAIFAITSASVIGGFKRGVYMTAGLVISDYVFIILAISGLSFVAEVMGQAFVIIKYLCAVYLVWLGFTLFFSKDSSEITEQSTHSNHSDIITGFLISLSNPKAIIFYVALFPAFVNVESISITEILGIMLCATLAFGIVNIGYSYLGAKARKLASTSSRFSLLRKCAGSVMAISGVAIAVRA